VVVLRRRAQAEQIRQASGILDFRAAIQIRRVELSNYYGRPGISSSRLLFKSSLSTRCERASLAAEPLHVAETAVDFTDLLMRSSAR